MRVFALSLLGLTAAACNYNGEPIGPLAANRTATIAIESIDGPPPAVSRRLAINLSEEAEARKLAVVAREEPAQYRLRGYLSPHVERGQTTIIWVWDVYGADKRRALRITGEEPSTNNGGDSSRDGWGAVDERVLRRIAQSGIDRILIFLNSSETTGLTAVPVTVPLTTNLVSAPPRS